VCVCVCVCVYRGTVLLAFIIMEIAFLYIDITAAYLSKQMLN